MAAKLEKEAELAELGIFDKYKEHRKKPLIEHLEDFKQSLINNGNTKKHAEMTYQRTKAIINNCKFIYITDVQPSLVLNEIGKLYKEKAIIEIDENNNKKKRIEKYKLIFSK